MGNQQKLRVLLLEDNTPTREMFEELFESRGYEVYSFSTPAVCPLQELKECRCVDKQRCVDIIFSDLKMPVVSGLDFIEAQRNKHCKCHNIALMSGDITQDAERRAKELDIRLFEKPVSIELLSEWLDAIDNDIDRDRELSDWFLK